MCGIFGIIHPASDQKVEALNRMSHSLTHRGPDEKGMYLFPRAALGHCRLNIIDLETGNQPMLTEDKQVGITYNGEIYGYKDIKKKLSFPFKTNSDTEVILALYQTHGSEMMRHLPGMFAFALWDEKKQKLFCARDRFGEKPFYYAIGRHNEFIFSSEIKAILSTGLVSEEIYRPALNHYLKRLYIHPHETIYSDIKCLPPGHFLEYDHSGISLHNYWELPAENSDLSFLEASEKFTYLFKQAVQRQLIADVPVGAFLSGGLDSTTIVSEASKINPELKTFSYGFNNEFNNELKYAKIAAEHYQTTHSELIENMDGIEELMINMQSIYDEPFADSSCIPTYLISKSAASEIKVVLTGDGGDELLGGYIRWYHPIESFQHSISKKSLLSQISKRLGFQSETKGKIGPGLKKYKSISELHNSQRDYFTQKDLTEFGFDLLESKMYSEDPINLDDVFRCDMSHYLPGDLLVKVDRASMANSLEIRSPFLDKDLAEFCISLPANYKVSNGIGKILLRSAYEDTWPEKIKYRGKMGFGAPVHQWLKKTEFIELKNEYLLNKNKSIYSYLEYDKVMEFFQKSNYQEWILLNLSLWLEHRKRC